jgi:dihydrofolate synthase/folylpolyglutamate synthase
VIRYPLALQGAIQLQNSALAIAALQILREQGWQISDQAIVEGMGKTQWPARLQWFTWRDLTILLDGAHNPASAEVLRQFVDTLASPSIHWVMGMLSTKDHADVFKALLRPGDSLYLVPVPDHSSADPTKLAILAQDVCPTLATCQTYPDVLPALEVAITMTEKPPLTVLCGSLYLIGNFLAKASGKNSSHPSNQSL